MKIKEVNLKQEAVIIADVHYKKGENDFLFLLKKWIKNPPPQVFFLGDIFHLLLPFEFLIFYNKEAIELIKELSEKTEIYYTPGNHDFNISSIFPNIVFADAFVDKSKSIFLTHGDLTDKDFFYKLYLKLIRNENGNRLMNIVSFNFVNNWLFKKILKKRIKCEKILNFEKKVFSKIADIDYKIIIEGHYHQNRVLNTKNKQYYALASFFCDKIYYHFKNQTLKAEYGNRR